MMEGGNITRHLAFLLLVNLVVSLPHNKRFDSEDLKDALQKVKLKRILEENILEEISELQQGEERVEVEEKSKKTARSNQGWKAKPHSGNEIDSYFSHPDPDSELTNEMASFVIEDNGERNSSHHPKGIEEVENKKSKLKGENHDVHKLLPGQLTPDSNKRGESHLVKKGFPMNPNLWPGGVVPYVIDSSLNETSYTDVIDKAIKQFDDKTCIRWVPKSSAEAEALNHDNYVNMFSGSGCYSYVGMINWGKQDLSLQTSYCVSVSTTVHEMAHAIGQWHEMSRSDRDSYLTMNWQNIGASKSNVNIMKVITKNYNPYDLESVLQYSLWALSNGNGQAMTPKDRRLDFLANIATGLMFYDVKDINIAYGCADNCANQTECQNGGFVIHNCKCYCPDHLTGDHCETLMTDQDCGGTITLDHLQSEQIISPQYPNNYPVNKTCVWVIQGPVGSFINLKINDFNLANSASACYHWLEVRYNMMGQNGPRLCSKMGKETITTTKDGNPNLMMLVFDSMVYDRAATKGFNLTVKAVGPGCAYNPCVLGNCSVDDDGNHACLCNEGVTGAACNIVNGNTTVNCSFEDRSHCFMTNVPADDFDWSLETTYTMTSNTGPSLAHGGSKYLYIESSPPRRNGNKAILVSNVDFTGSNTYCLTMWYHMYGKFIGSLEVKTNSSTLWSKTGDQGNSWELININVPMMPDQKLSIEGVVGGGGTGDIAIDDLKLSPGPCDCSDMVCKNGGTCIEDNGRINCQCPVGISGIVCQNSVCDANDCMLGTCSTNPNNGSSYLCSCLPGITGALCDTVMVDATVSCSFEPGEVCYLHNITGSDDFDWSVKSGITSSSYTGPSAAHGGLYYSYIESSSPRRLGDEAVLYSCKFAPATRCLHFWYHMYGGGTGNLTVSLSGSPVFTRSGNKGNKWNEAYVEIPDSDTYVVKLTGVRGSSYTGDIAIDDVMVSPGTCACAANPCVNGVCVDDTSSSVGYNCTCDLGYVGVNCDTPICQTNPCVTNAVCLEDLSCIDGYRCVCKPGYYGDDCHPNACTNNLCNQGQCNIIGNDTYTCSCNTGFFGQFCDIASNANADACSWHSWDYKNQLDNGSTQMICDFEPGAICFLENSHEDDADWMVFNGTTQTSGPTPDLAKKRLQYIYTTTSYTGVDLKSKFTFEASERCLVFWYYLSQSGTDPASLEVLNCDTLLWDRTGNQGNEWHQGRVDLPRSQNLQLTIRGKTTNSATGTIALDFVQLHPGKCLCKGDPCGTGTCSVDDTDPNGYVCTCTNPAYYGQNCQTHVCDSVDCGFGNCQYDGNSGGAICVCMDGITGSQCDKAIANATLMCDFEQGSFCFLEDVNTDDFDWTVNSGRTASASTGPSGAANGQHYIYAEASVPQSQGNKAILSSTLTFPAAPRCLTFQYHMYGQDMGSLNILGNDNNLWSVSSDQGNLWLEGRVNISSNDYPVAFEAVMGSSWRSDIALDDIKLSPGFCN